MMLIAGTVLQKYSVFDINQIPKSRQKTTELYKKKNIDVSCKMQNKKKETASSKLSPTPYKTIISMNFISNK